MNLKLLYGASMAMQLISVKCFFIHLAFIFDMLFCAAQPAIQSELAWRLIDQESSGGARGCERTHACSVVGQSQTAGAKESSRWGVR